MIFNAPEIESNLKYDVEKSNCQIANKILKLCGASEEVTVEQTTDTDTDTDTEISLF